MMHGLCWVKEMRTIAAAAGLVLVSVAWFGTGPATAGCANYSDGSLEAKAPRAILCYKDKCDRTALVFMCSNTSSTSAGYAIGWAVSQPVDAAKPTISWQGKPIVTERNKHLTCYEIDSGSCHFPNSVTR